jgi:hypothetical protein
VRSREPEAVEPLGVRRVAAEAGAQPVRPVPAAGAAHAAGVLDRQRGRVGLLPGVLGDGDHQPLAELLEGAAQPAHAAVELALVGQDREVVPQSRRTSARNPASLGRASRWRTSAIVSTSASEQAGAGPGRGGTATAPALSASSTKT